MSATNGRPARHGAPPVLDVLIAAYAAWTVGFWLALALGRGWVIALAFSIVAAAAILAARERWRVDRPRSRESGDDTSTLGLVLLVVVAWPIVLDVGRVAAVALALTCLVIRGAVVLLTQRAGRRDLDLVLMGVLTVAAAAAFRIGWPAFVLVVCGAAGAAVAWPKFPQWPAPHQPGCERRRFRSTSHPGPTGSATGGHEDPSFRDRGLRTGLLAGFGLLLGVWLVGARYWSSDNAYYLNKAAHFAASPWSFPSNDLMFGASDATHYPLGNLLSSFEPLLGLLSALTGISTEAMLFRVVVPASMFLIPFAARYAARGLELRRPDLVAGLTGAAVLLMTGTSTTNLFGPASYGKTIGGLVVIPLVIGTAGQLVRYRDPASAVRAVLTSVAAVGLSPSLAAAVLLVIAPFTVAAGWELWRARAAADRRPRVSIAWLLLPIAVVGLFALFALQLQQGAGTSQTTAGFTIFRAPDEAWMEAFLRRKNPSTFLTLLFLAGSTAAVPLVADDRGIRRALGGMMLLIFGVVFSPWGYDAIVGDLLGLDYVAWRLLWALPGALLIGAVLAGVDGRRRLARWTVAAATLGLGLSGPDLTGTTTSALRPPVIDIRQAPRVWPWDAGIPEDLAAAARAIARVTPEGRRYLAPKLVEEVATATQIKVFPVYVREVYVIPVGKTEPAPTGFGLEARLLLADAIAGQAPLPSEAQVEQALDQLDVVTVCLTGTAAPALSAVVSRYYSSVGVAGACEIWSRTGE